MPSLKDLKIQINSVKSTQKITSAMKMVAAAKLRRAQENAEAARPYAERMERMLGSLASSMAGREGAPPLLAGNGRDQVHGRGPAGHRRLDDRVGDAQQLAKVGRCFHWRCSCAAGVADSARGRQGAVAECGQDFFRRRAT